MQLDHLSFAAGPEGAAARAAVLGDLLGAEFADGGFHPRFGTRNQILPLAHGRYLDDLEVAAVRARAETGGGWLGWVVAVDDLLPVEARLGRLHIDGHRHRPDGELLEWQQIGVKGLQADPQLPFFIRWLSDADRHPSYGGGEIALLKLEIAGDSERVDDWLGGASSTVLRDIDIDWVAPHGQPGLVAATFGTPHGVVRI